MLCAFLNDKIEKQESINSKNWKVKSAWNMGITIYKGKGFEYELDNSLNINSVKEFLKERNGSTHSASFTIYKEKDEGYCVHYYEEHYPSIRFWKSEVHKIGSTDKVNIIKELIDIIMKKHDYTPLRTRSTTTIWPINSGKLRKNLERVLLSEETINS